jgi:hypothetical protein
MQQSAVPLQRIATTDDVAQVLRFGLAHPNSEFEPLQGAVA